MKRTAIFILLIFIYGCGYTAVYKNTKTQDLKINVSFNIQKNSNSYEQRNYEKKIRENFGRSAIDKLIKKLMTINDN